MLAERYRIVALARPRRHGRGLPRRRPEARPAGGAQVPARGAAGRRRPPRALLQRSADGAPGHAPAVCRVHDVGEVDGQLFLSMEYVDGEDLGSLLRRIGRLPPGQGGRDRPPALRGPRRRPRQGRAAPRPQARATSCSTGGASVRITDFGLPASWTATAPTTCARARPAYMSPEQLARARGHRAQRRVRARPRPLRAVHRQARVRRAHARASCRASARSCRRSPSSVVGDLDPAAERAILRCLEKEPADRPQSAMAVAAALPGGDPLAAALAAGETPSPEMVAALATGEGLAPRVGGGLPGPGRGGADRGADAGARHAARGDGAAGAVRGRPRGPRPRAGAAHRLHGAPRRRGGRVGPRHGLPAVGARRTTSLRSAGPASPPRSRRWSSSGTGRARGCSSPEHLGPRLLRAAGADGQRHDRRADGHQGAAGPVLGRPAADRGAGPAGAGAGLVGRCSRRRASTARVSGSVAPQWLPADYADRRAAWEGPYASRDDIPIRIEAASYRGVPTWFEIVAPWGRPQRMQPFQLTHPPD